MVAKIYVNGDAQEVSLPLNVSELIQKQNVLQPEMVSVQVNEEFAEREDWESIQLKEGDKVDFQATRSISSTLWEAAKHWTI